MRKTLQDLILKFTNLFLKNISMLMRDIKIDIDISN